MAKRGNSEGSIYQKKNGVWEAALSAGHVDGRPVRRYFTGKTHQEVAKKRTKAIADRDRGLPSWETSRPSRSIPRTGWKRG
jgi:hypothetical protein